jgi:Rrf2 family protein
MRLEITRRADLAVRAMVTLGTSAGRMKGGDLAEDLGTTPAFLPQVVAPLVKAGWVRSDPGPTGGYSSHTPLHDITVLDVIEAVDGPTDAGRCVVANRPCATGPTCALHVAWARARTELTSSLGRTRLSDLAQELA